jgi:hypothetical protein
MDSYKIDILNLQDTIVVQNENTQDQQYFNISALSTPHLEAYTTFIKLVDSKTLSEYTQIYVAKEPVIRFVALIVQGIETANFEETLYDSLTVSEQEIFDSFFNTFIK